MSNLPFPRTHLLLAGCIVIFGLTFFWLPAVAQAPPGPAAAAPTPSPLKFIPQVGIPVSGEEAKPFQLGQETKADPSLLGKYIATIYRLGLWLAIFLAIFMMMVGGFLWLIAGGSSERVSSAKGYIGSALTGLVVALTSFVLLQTVNPRLVELSIPQPTIITGEPLTARALRSPGVRSPESLCHPGLRVDDSNQCDDACQELGLGGALRVAAQPPSLGEIIAPVIPSPDRMDFSREFCCACEKRPCLNISQECSRGGLNCCPPLSCNQAPPIYGSCQPINAGGTEYSRDINCSHDDNCLSGLCFDGFLGADYCVPVELFPDDHSCNRAEECRSEICAADNIIGGPYGKCFTLSPEHTLIKGAR